MEPVTAYDANQNEATPRKQRTPIITVICVLGFVGAIITVPLIFSDTAASIGSWYPPYLGLSAILGFVCMVGLWQMKKWAVYLYITVVLLNQVVLLAMGVWSIGAIVIPGIVAALAFSQLDKME